MGIIESVFEVKKKKELMCCSFESSIRSLSGHIDMQTAIQPHGNVRCFAKLSTHSLKILREARSREGDSGGGTDFL